MHMCPMIALLLALLRGSTSISHQTTDIVSVSNANCKNKKKNAAHRKLAIIIGKIA